jgi:gamma-glutamyltranspeptidase/glutathione hydrolase
MHTSGVVAAGHEQTARTAQIILQEGGNAFDAIVAAHFSACVVEPVLASLGGGGYLLAHSEKRKNVVYDFFVQTPQQKKHPDNIDFYPISADFGTAQQEFHIGWGSVATPGTVKGLFAIHKDLCTMPMRELLHPAIALAKEGVVVNGFQAYIFEIVHAILTATPASRKIFCSQNSERLITEGELHQQTQLADCLDALSFEGESLFYQGEIAQLIMQASEHSGGHLGLNDLSSYQVNKSAPLELNYRDTTILTNPPPSSGGILIAFALKLLEEINFKHVDFGSVQHLDVLAHVMALTNKVRLDEHFNDSIQHTGRHLLDPDFLSLYKQQIYKRAQVTRGTTHISVMDKLGNMASLTTSNGEGCGHILNGTGIMLNNMLGEEDLNPRGFHKWTCNQRMTSMMSPTLAFSGHGQRIALGSGGSNRLRTAILQVLVNLTDFDMPLDEAVNSPRIHFENDLLSIEKGFDHSQIELLCRHYTKNTLWKERNLFFGGTHAVMEQQGKFSGIGDPRRGGSAITIE